MITKLLATALVISSLTFSAQANHDDETMTTTTQEVTTEAEVQPTASMADSSISQASSVDSDLVKCWGWDGSTNGQIKTMTRGACLDAHGIVQNQDIRAQDEQPVVKPVHKYHRKKHK